MDSSNNDRLQSLFEEALSLPLESRDAFLRERCGSDAELLQRLRRMLEPDRTGELSALVDLARQSTDLLDERPETASRAGETVGAYRLVRSIGSGTFGEVFLAEQAEPVVRQVAVKVLHAGMNSAEVVRRFRAEQQSLARMDHPNIAKVYDAGVTERGLPYFVMQYVPGEPITEYCDRRRLSIDERLRLFRRVCEAVEHAHIKSVVHRDLKPSNVLVTSTEGGGPEPMVIDFGVAKVIAEGEHTETAHRTEAGLAVGTWAYMSPEQAAGDPDVDTRSDVYSLGVMLYELLCGAKPFEGETLRNAAEAELRRMIREDEPPRPSDRLRSDGTAPSCAAARKTGVSELARRLRSELEWIPLFAMRKDRERRYQRAAELGDDVGNYLLGRPLLAGPERASYRLRKFARRNLVSVVAGGVVVVALATGLGVSLAALREASRERTRAGVKANEAEQEAQRANREAEAAHRARDTSERHRRRAEDTLDLFRSSLRSADPENLGTQGMSVAQAMAQAVESLNQGRLKAQPEDDAFMRLTIAEILGNNGRARDALELAEAALATNRSLYGDDHVEVARSLGTVSRCLSGLGRFAEASQLAETALGIFERAIPGDSADVANALTDAASRAIELGKWSLVLTSLGRFQAALEMRQRLAPGDTPATAAAIHNVALCLDRLGKFKQSMPRHQRALAMFRRLYPTNNPDVARNLTSTALCYFYLNDFASAEQHFREALSMRRALYPGDHPTIAGALGNLALCEMGAHRPTDAHPHLVEALEMLQRIHTGDHPDLVRVRTDLAMCLRALGRLNEAERTANDAVTIAHRTLAEDHPIRTNAERCLSELLEQSRGR